MELFGKQHIPTSKGNVWLALNNLEVLKACIPECETIEWVSDTEIALTVGLKLGILKTRIGGTIYLSNIIEEQSYTMVGKGKGKFAGLANGRADVKLVKNPSGSGTILSYKVTAIVGGEISKTRVKDC